MVVVESTQHRCKLMEEKTGQQRAQRHISMHVGRSCAGRPGMQLGLGTHANSTIHQRPPNMRLSKAAHACPALLGAQAAPALWAAGRQARGLLTTGAALKARGWPSTRVCASAAAAHRSPPPHRPRALPAFCASPRRWRSRRRRRRRRARSSPLSRGTPWLPSAPSGALPPACERSSTLGPWRQHVHPLPPSPAKQLPATVPQGVVPGPAQGAIGHGGGCAGAGPGAVLAGQVRGGTGEATAAWCPGRVRPQIDVACWWCLHEPALQAASPAAHKRPCASAPPPRQDDQGPARGGAGLRPGGARHRGQPRRQRAVRRCGRGGWHIKEAPRGQAAHCPPPALPTPPTHAGSARTRTLRMLCLTRRAATRGAQRGGPSLAPVHARRQLLLLLSHPLL